MENNKSIPLYMKIYEKIQHGIADSTYSVGSLLPSEAELQELYNVSRITVRRALSDLEHDGFIQRIKGKGTIVLPKKQYSDLYELTGFSEDAKNSGDTPSSVILKCEVQQASVTVANFLQIEPNEDVYYLKRLKLLNGRISGIFETYITQRLNFKIDVNKFSDKTSLYDYYEENGVFLGYASETIEAIMATSTLKREMFLDKEEPIFYRERITYDNKNVPIEFSKNFYKANGYKYVVRLHRGISKKL
ncbi:MAG: GntR family transcriptional regulator [Erysipelotrichales bacterium]|nr:GntR family transcriptional regulator [Erysipelotrichales bacterium]